MYIYCKNKFTIGINLKWILYILSIIFFLLLLIFISVKCGVNNEIVELNNTLNLSKHYNWAEIGSVTYVKNREFCRSDWAFSVTGALEGQWFFKTGKLISLSEQNLIDCSYDLGNNGCNGGGLSYAFEYISKNNGISSETCYPYQGEENFICWYNKSCNAASVKAWKEIDANGDEDKLLQILIEIGPISVGINVQPSFWKYTSGIYYEEKCTNRIDYAVLLVGYGTLWSLNTGTDYWIIKNCMGTRWGEKGYMRLARNRNNHCGIANYGRSPYCNV